MSDRQRLEALRKRKRLEELRAMKAAETQKPTPTVMERIAGADLKRRQMTDAAQTGIGQGLSLGFMDEIAGGAAALGALVPGGRSPAEAYRETTDQTRDYVAEQKERNPVAFTAGEIGGGLATGLSGGARMAGIKGSAALGAGYGAGTADGGLMDRVKGAGVGAMVGAGTHYGTQKLGQGVSKLLQRKPAQTAPVPDLDELKAAKNALYKQVDDQGAVYSPEQIQALYRGVADEVKTDGLGRITSKTHPATKAMIKQMAGQSDNPATLSELDSLRQLAGSASVTNPADQRTAGLIRQNIDEFTESMTPAAGGDASDLIKQARAANARFRKSELVDDLIEKGKRRAASTGSGGNEQNAIRQNIRRILDNPKLRRGFSDDEIAQLERVVEGTPGQNLTRLIGKLSPEGNGLMAMLGIGGTAIHPPLALASGAGFVSKRASERIANNNLDDLVRLVRTGSPVAPVATPASQAAQNPRIQELLARAGAFAAIN
jgi:hypothetical protein